MGGFVDSFFGTGGEGQQAADIQSRFYQQAIDEQRRQFDITQGNINPFMQAGADALPDVIQGTTAVGLDQRLNDIFNSDIFGSLVDERQRAVEGQLGAGGLSRSGTALQEAARIPTDIGLALEGLLTGRATNLAGSGQNAAMGLGSLGSNNASAIGSLLVGQGQTLGSGILADAQARGQGVQNVLGLAGSASSFFSDPRLKKNAEKISEIGDLSLWEWDWIPEAAGTLIEVCPNTGFMADEVADKYPHHVGEFGGFAVINYPELLNELEVKYGT